VASCSVLQHVGYIGYKCLRHLEGTQSKLKFQQITQDKTPPIRKGTSRCKWRGNPKDSWANKRNCLWTTKKKGETHYLPLRKG